mgnify:CR=1 FL=1
MMALTSAALELNADGALDLRNNALDNVLVEGRAGGGMVIVTLTAKGATPERPGVSNDFFNMLYQVLLGEERGPRFGSFAALYGLDNTRRLIDDALGGKLAKPLSEPLAEPLAADHIGTA